MVRVDAQTGNGSWRPALKALYPGLGPVSCERAILTGAALVDPETETVTSPSLAVIGDGGLLEYCGKPDMGLTQKLLSIGYTQWELAGRLLLPAFADAHVHLGTEFSSDTGQGSFSVEKSLSDLHQSVRSGIGFLRDCGSPGFFLVDLREHLKAFDGPRLLTCGMPITTPKGHMHSIAMVAKNEAELKMAVDRLARQGVDFIKICATGGKLTHGSDPTLTQYNASEMRAVVNSAADHGLVVSAHAHGTDGIKVCVEAGVQWIEHCSFMEPGGGYQLDPYLLEKMAAGGLSIGFTLTRFKWNISPEDVTALEQGQEVAPYSHFKRLLKAIQKAGVNFGIASDGGIPGSPFGCLNKILWAAKEIYQVPDWEIIKSVTTTPAGLWREKGKACLRGRRAELVAIRGDLESLFKQNFKVEHLFLGKTAFSAFNSQRGRAATK